MHSTCFRDVSKLMHKCPRCKGSRESCWEVEAVEKECELYVAKGVVEGVAGTEEVDTGKSRIIVHV